VRVRDEDAEPGHRDADQAGALDLIRLSSRRGTPRQVSYRYRSVKGYGQRKPFRLKSAPPWWGLSVVSRMPPRSGVVRIAAPDLSSKAGERAEPARSSLTRAALHPNRPRRSTGYHAACSVPTTRARNFNAGAGPPLSCAQNTPHPSRPRRPAGYRATRGDATSNAGERTEPAHSWSRGSCNTPSSRPRRPTR
jgi:hypothetical protein